MNCCPGFLESDSRRMALLRPIRPFLGVSISGDLEVYKRISAAFNFYPILMIHSLVIEKRWNINPSNDILE